MSHILKKLPYGYGDLEPSIDAKTVEIHYSKHHQGYVDKLNAALEKYPDLQEKTLDELLSDFESIPDDIRTAVRNNGGGHYAHTLYWDCMNKNGGGEPTGELLETIKNTFGSFDSFKNNFSEMSTTHFASGWAWLSKDENGKLEISTTSGHDTPIAESRIPLLVLDLWEHAYYLKYQNRRPEYIEAWFDLIDWEKIQETYLR